MEQTLSSAPAAPIMAKAKISPTMMLIKNALKIYQQRFWSFVAMGLAPILGAIPLLVSVSLFLVSLLVRDQDIGLIIKIILGILGLASVVVAIYIALAAQAGFILILKNSGSKFGEAFKAGRGYAWPLFAVGLLVGIFVLLWSILFIIPGIIFAVYYGQAYFVLLFEDKKGMSALKRSKELVKNYWWPVAGRNLLLGLVFSAVFIVLSLPLNAIKDNAVIYQFWNIIINVVSFLFGQFAVVFSYLIFKDLRQIKGFGQEARPIVS